MMAEITREVLPVNLDIKDENNFFPKEFMQDESNATLEISLLIDGQRATVPNTAEISVTLLYNIDIATGHSEYGYKLDSKDSNYKITIDNGKIIYPLDNLFTQVAGTNNMILKVLVKNPDDASDILTSYSYSMYYKVKDNPSFSGKSVIDNIPTVENLQKEVEDLDKKVTTYDGRLTSNTNTINSLTINKANTDLSNTPLISGAKEGHMYYFKNGRIQNAPLRIDDTTKKILTDYSLEVPANSLYIGSNIHMRADGDSLDYIVESTMKNYLLIASENDPANGTKPPVYYKRSILEGDFELQNNIGTTLTGVTNIDLGSPAFDRIVQGMYLNFASNVNNLKMKIVIDGKDSAFYPSREAWDKNEVAGYNLSAGRQLINLNPSFQETNGLDTEIVMKADSSISLKGSATQPYISLNMNRITKYDMALKDDILTLMTPEKIRDLLQTLVGDNRLDATAIKNISSGGSTVSTLAEVLANGNTADRPIDMDNNEIQNVKELSFKGSSSKSPNLNTNSDGDVVVKNQDGTTFATLEQTGRISTLTMDSDDINTNKNDISTIKTDISNKADKDLGNVQIIASSPNGSTFFVKNGALYVSPLTVDELNQKIISTYPIEVPPNSIYLGDNVHIHENGGFVEYDTQTLGKRYIFLDYENDLDNGTSKPTYWERGIKEINVDIYSVKSQDMTISSTPINFGFSSYHRQVQSIGFDFVKPVNNFKMKFIVNGKDIAYFPSKEAWNDNTVAGYDISSTGVQKINLEPLFSSLTSYDISIAFKGDSEIVLKGDGNKPYVVEDLNRITPYLVALENDIPTTTKIISDMEALSGENRLDYNALKNKPSGSIVDKIQFTESLGVLANNKTGNTITEGTFVFLEAETNYSYNMRLITKSTGYKGELIGIVDSDTDTGNQGLVKLNCVVKTENTTASEGELAYVGFDLLDPSNDDIEINSKSSVGQVFGICGVFGKKDSVDGKAYATFNSVEVQASHLSTNTIADIHDVLTQGEDAKGLDIENIGQISSKPTSSTKKWVLNTDDLGSFRVRDESNNVFFIAGQDGTINHIPLTNSGDGNSFLANDGAYKTINSSGDITDVEFEKSFGIQAINSSGKTINADKWVLIYPKKNGTFGMEELTHSTGYKGELFGYLDSGVGDGATGFVKLITTVETGVTGTSEGQISYIGFDSDTSLANVEIGTKDTLSVIFGECGVFGEKNSVGEAFSTFNAFQVQANTLIKKHHDSDIAYYDSLPAVINPNALFVHLMAKIVAPSGVIYQEIPALNIVTKGTQIMIENQSVTTTAKIELQAYSGDKIEGQDFLTVDGGSIITLLATNNSWIKVYDSKVHSDAGTILIGQTHGDYRQGTVEEIEVHAPLDLTFDADNNKVVGLSINPNAYALKSDLTQVETEVNRLKTDISDGTKPVFVFRDRGIPIESELTAQDYKAYYIHSTVLRGNQSLQLPASKAEETIFVIENNDRSNTIILTPPSGETINSLSSFVCGSDTLNFFIKKGIDWKQAYGGIFPNSLTSLKSTIQNLLTTQLHTMDEISAQLKSMGFLRDVQNYLQKYLRTDDQFDALATSLGFSKGFSVGYGLVTSQTIPNDKTWITAYISPNQEVLIPKTTGTKYLALFMPVFFEPLVSEVVVNGNVIETTKKEIVINDLHYAVLISNDAIDVSQNIRVQIKFSDEMANLVKGITVDDGTTNIAGVTNIEFDQNSMEITKVIDNQHIKMRTVTSWETLDGMGSSKAGRVLIEPPLLTYLDPDVPSGESPRAKLYVKHGYFELAKPPSYLAYLQEDEEVMGRLKPNEAGIRIGKVWFDDLVVGGNSTYIEIDKPNKAIGIQDYTDDDPNVTGGVPTLIAYRIAMKGKAPDDGFVEIYLKKTDEGTPTQDGGYLLNSNGNPIGVRREYKAGQDLGYLDAMSIYMAKEITKFQCVVEHSFADDGVMLEDRTEGASGLLIQALGKNYATGDALLQFENDTMQNIEFTKHYNGDDIFNMAWALQEDLAETSITAGVGQTTVDGLHFYNNTNLKAGISSGVMTIQDNGTDMSYFSLGKIFTAEKTFMLRNKDLDIKVTLQDKDEAYRIYVAKWTGSPDKFTEKIIDHHDADQGAIPETNWTLSDSIFISEDAVSGEHDFAGTLTVPADANNFAIIIAPVTKQTPQTLKIKGFEVSVSEPFYGWILEAPELINEKHLQFNKEYRELRCDVKGYQGIRYTLNNVPAGQPMPIGVLGKGKADIEIDHTINQVAGSSLPQFEGAIKFLKEGKATIKTELYVHSEKAHSILATTKFWYSKVSTDGATFTKIPLSEYSTQVRGQTKAINRMPEFSIDVQAGDRIALFGTSDQADGAFIDQVAGDPTPMLKTTINFDEITSEESDLLNTINTIDNEIVFSQDAIDNGVYLFVDYDVDSGKPSITAKKR